MNSAQQVSNMIANWKASGKSKAELTVLIAESCIGWPYVWGSYGQEDTVATRKAYMNRSAISAGDAELIRKRCQVLNGSSSGCSGCKYYPNGARTRMFDCRGFTRWVLQQAGCGTIQGAGATSQWNDNSNWSQKGEIRDLPDDVVCCVFKKVGSKMEHTGICIGHKQIIHCSVEVKRGKTTDSGWTHFAIPNGLDGSAPVPEPTLPTLRYGSSGEYVTLLQTKLIQRDYDLSPYGADGKFGRKTESEVKKFQKDNGLTADGIVGKNTWTALESAETSFYTVTIPHLSRSVAETIIGQYGGTKEKEGD